jgi:Ca-activated chloride channel family protein
MTTSSSATQKNALQFRTRALLVTTLLAVTIAAGSVARVGGGAGSGAPPDIPEGNGLRFAAPAGGGVHFSAHLDRGSVLAGGGGIVKMELVLGAEERPTGEGVRLPTDLLVILDRSGSMQGVPLGFAKAAVRELLEQLGSQDRFALVTYASSAHLVIPLGPASPTAREGWLATLDAVRAGGDTNMASGIDVAHAAVSDTRVPGRAVRAILVSDGHANTGDHSLQGLRARAARAVPGEYVLSSVGVGPGFDEGLMGALADAGTGNFYYLREGRALAGVFADEFAAARETLASALEVAIAPHAGVEVVDAAGYPLERSGDEVLFRPGSLFAGQERRVWVTLRVPATQTGTRPLGSFSLRFLDVDGERHTLAFRESPRVACVARTERFLASVDDDTWARSVIVDEYGALKQRVSSYLRAGKEHKALSEIEAYRARSGEMNVHFERDDVAQQLEDAAGLARSVRESVAAGPRAQNALSKKLAAEGQDGRRVGSKR